MPLCRGTGDLVPKQSIDGIVKCRGRRKCYQRTNIPYSIARKRNIGKAYTVSDIRNAKDSDRALANPLFIGRATQVDESQSASQSSRLLIIVRSGAFGGVPAQGALAYFSMPHRPLLTIQNCYQSRKPAVCSQGRDKRIYTLLHLHQVPFQTSPFSKSLHARAP